MTLSDTDAALLMEAEAHGTHLCRSTYGRHWIDIYRMPEGSEIAGVSVHSVHHGELDRVESVRGHDVHEMASIESSIPF